MHRQSLIIGCAILFSLLLSGCGARQHAPLAEPSAAGPEPLLLAQNETPDPGAGEVLDDADWDAEWEALAEEEPGAEIADPLEGWNRAMFTVNDKLYFYLIKPVAQTYALVIPEALRIGVDNIFTNLGYPVRFVNSVLQGKGTKAAKETGRFALNTTFGFLGLVRISDRFPELTTTPEDTGQTLGAWGAGNGFYIVWPVLGASTVRDSLGLVGDYFLDPINYVDPSELRWGIKAEERVNTTSFKIGEYEDLKESALDPYISLRNAYIQHRQSLVED